MAYINCQFDNVLVDKYGVLNTCTQECAATVTGGGLSREIFTIIATLAVMIMCAGGGCWYRRRCIRLQQLDNEPSPSSHRKGAKKHLRKERRFGKSDKTDEFRYKQVR
jgi:hypothetical protein